MGSEGKLDIRVNQDSRVNLDGSQAGLAGSTLNMHDLRQAKAHPVRGIVFDAVGTLIEASPSVSAAYAQAAARQGIELDLSLVRARFSHAFRQDEAHELRGPLATDESIELRRWKRIVTCVLPEVSDVDRAFDDLWRHFADPARWTIHEDALAALQAFQNAGIDVLLGSNFDARLRDVLAGHPPLSHLAERVVISSEVGYRKPHPAFYESARASLNLPAAEILCIGDDLENDVLGPRRCGFQAVLIDREGMAGLDQLSAHQAVTDLRALAARILGKSFAGPLSRTGTQA